MENFGTSIGEIRFKDNTNLSDYPPLLPFLPPPKTNPNKTKKKNWDYFSNGCNSSTDQIIYTGDKIGNEVNKTIYTGIVNLNTNNIFYDLGDSKTFNDNSIITYSKNQWNGIIVLPVEEL
ncbi:hypothetical protein ACTFIT_006587 [Dictyostelium discoideum]